MPAVVRIDTGGTHGYQARIGGSVGYESKLFSDKKCGGKRKAKAAAIAWLEERGDRYAPRRFGPKKGIQVNNMSGTPGVHQSQLTRNGNVSRYWAAHYSIGPNGRRTHRSKRFYFGTKRTSDEARGLAEEFRTGWVTAFEAEGVNGVKQFFKEWEEKHPGRATRKKTSSAKKSATTKKTPRARTASTAVKDKPVSKAETDEKPKRAAKGKAESASTARAATKAKGAAKDSAAKPKRGAKAKPETTETAKAESKDKPARKSRQTAKAKSSEKADSAEKAKSGAGTKSRAKAKPAGKKSEGTKSAGRKSSAKKK